MPSESITLLIVISISVSMPPCSGVTKLIATPAADAAGAADAVHVILSLHRQIEIDDVGDRWHVNAAAHHVGGDQALQFRLAERGRDLLAVALRQVAVDSRSRSAVGP